MKKGDWLLCPLTKDDVESPTIVAKAVNIGEKIVEIQLYDGTVKIPKNYCRVVFVQKTK